MYLKERYQTSTRIYIQSLEMNTGKEKQGKKNSARLAITDFLSVFEIREQSHSA